MEQGADVLDLLLEWESRLEGGEPATPEELCRGRPDLLDVFLRAASRLNAVSSLLALDGGGPPCRLPDFPGYQVLGRVGAGGMGVVYKAYDPRLCRTVAIKLPGVRGAAAAHARSRFEREARALASLNHPNIVPIHMMNEVDGQPYFVMAYYPTGSLAESLRRRRPSPAEAGALVEQVARAVHCAHEKGVLHRDLKPSNILLGEGGAPCVADFGLAAMRWEPGEEEGPGGQPPACPAGPRLTGTGWAVGTRGYMAPEVKAGAEAGPEADVYSLGAVLYQLLSLRLPFPGDTRGEADQPAPLGPEGVPEGLEAVCLKCLSFDPRARYATALELAEDLARALQGEAPSALQLSPAARALSWGRRNAWLGAVGLLPLAAAVAAFSWLGRAPETAPGPEPRPEAGPGRERLERALDSLRGGEVPRGLHQLVRALASRPALEEGLERVARSNFSAWGRRLTALKEVGPQRGLVASIAPHPNGGKYLLALYRPEEDRGEAQLVDAGSLVPAGKPFAKGPGIWSAAFSPGGETVVTCGEDGVVRQWRAQDGSQAGPPLAHPSPARSLLAVALLGAGGGPTGPWAASFWASRARAVPPRRVVAAFHLPGRKGLLTVGAGALWWWAPGGRLLRTALTGPGTVRAAALSPDGSAVALGFGSDGANWGELGRPGWVQVWGVDRGQPLSPRMPHQAGVNAVAFHPDGRRVAAGSDDGLARAWLYQATPPSSLAIAHQGPVQSVAYSPDGKFLFTGTGRWTIRRGEGQLWDADTGARVGHPLPHRGLVSAALFRPNPEGVSVVTGCHDRAARLWERREARPRQALAHGAAVSAVAFSPDGAWAVTGSRGGEVRFWAASDWKPARAAGRHGPAVHALCFLAGGKVVATAGDDGAVRFWALAGGEAASAFRAAPARTLRAVAASRDGRHLATGGTDGLTRVWKWPSRRLAWEFRSEGRAVTCLAFSPDGRRVLVGDTGGQARQYALDTGRPVGGAALRQKAVYSAVYSPDGKAILVAGADRQACCFDAETGRPRGRPLPHHDEVRAACFSGDGLAALTGCADGTARLWDVASGLPLGPPLDHRFAVATVALGPGGAALTASGREASAWAGVAPARDGTAVLRLKALLATGAELRGDAVLEPLLPEDWLAHKKRLKSLKAARHGAGR